MKMKMKKMKKTKNEKNKNSLIIIEAYQSPEENQLRI